MRWSVDAPKSWNPGDVREKRQFLLFPKKIGNEYRWLEYASWREEAYQGLSFAPDRGPAIPVLQWRPVAWVDEE